MRPQPSDQVITLERILQPYLRRYGLYSNYNDQYSITYRYFSYPTTVYLDIRADNIRLWRYSSFYAPESIIVPISHPDFFQVLNQTLRQWISQTTHSPASSSPFSKTTIPTS